MFSGFYLQLQKLTLVLSWMFLFGALNTKASDEAMRVCPVIKVAGGDWLKYKYIERYKGSATGKGIEILKAFKDSVGAEVLIMEDTPFVRQLKQLKRGELDLMVGLYDIQQRRHAYSLSVPYYEEPLHVYALEGTFTNHVTLASLDRLVVGLRRGSSYGDVIDNYLNSAEHYAVEVKSSENVAMLLLKGRIDYFIATPTVHQEFLSVSERIVKYNSIATQNTSFAFSRNSKCVVWLETLNELIEKSSSKPPELRSSISR